MISVQWNSYYVFKQVMFQVVPPTHFCTCNIWSAAVPKQSQGNFFLLDFTVDRWASCTNIVLDFQCNFLEQQVPKSKFGSSLPILTLIKRFALLSWSTVDGEVNKGRWWKGGTSSRVTWKWEGRLSPFIQFAGALLLSYKGLQAGW